MLEPDFTVFLQEWWGGGSTGCFPPWVSEASNILTGGNPTYQVSDFLAMYPKFGTYPQAIQTITLANAGTGYAINDVLVITQDGGASGSITVNTVDGSGHILTFTLSVPGTGYRVANSLPVTGGTGTGALFNITAIVPGTFPTIPLIALQTYVSLATCCLQKERWQCQWSFAVGLFVAHYATLWEKSEGSPGTTAGQIAASGLSIGLRTAQAAGDVSESLQYLQSLEEFGAWALTTYGQQLATIARIVGMGPMYIFG